MIETDDAYIVEVDGDNKSLGTSDRATPSTKIFTNNQLVNGLVFGAGAGIVGSLVVGALFDQKNNHKNCLYRYKRDGTGSARYIVMKSSRCCR